MKKFIFSDGGDINVTCLCTLLDSDNENENFVVKSIKGINTPQEMKMFQWLKVGFPVTINEINFFSLNTGTISATITDFYGNFEKNYGVITTTTSTSTTTSSTTTTTTTTTTTHSPTTTTTTIAIAPTTTTTTTGG